MSEWAQPLVEEIAELQEDCTERDYCVLIGEYAVSRESVEALLEKWNQKLNNGIVPPAAVVIQLQCCVDELEELLQTN